MLTDKVDFVIGFDNTHRDSRTAAVITAAGGVIHRLPVATDAFGFRKLDAFARMLPTHECGRSKAPAASVRVSPRTYWNVASGWSKLTVPQRPARREALGSTTLMLLTRHASVEP